MLSISSSSSVKNAIAYEFDRQFSSLEVEFDRLFSMQTSDTKEPESTELGDPSYQNVTLVNGVTPAPTTIVTPSTSVSTSPSVSSYNDIIAEMSAKYEVPEALIRSVIRAESSFNPNAVSSAGAQGLMQLMPETAKSLGVTDAFDPRQNIEGGTKYLRKNLDRFGDIKLAVAAYNAGPGAVEKYGGVPPYEETQNYVKKVLGSL